MKEILKKEFIVIQLIVVLSVGIGMSTGFLLKKKLSPEIIDYTNIKIENYYEDTEKVMKKYSSYTGNDVFKDFTVSELINIAQYKYISSPISYSYGVGIGDAKIVKQSIYSYQIRNENEFFEESLSSSTFVKVAKRMYQTGDEVREYNGQLVSENQGNFDDNFSSFTKEDYSERMGKSLDKVFIYIISNQTILSSSIENDGNYNITVELDKDISVYHYVHQMKTISSLKDYPIFQYVKLTYTLDKDLNIISLRTNEKYTATTQSSISSDVECSILYHYFANQKIDIPELNQKLTYGGENND